MIIYNGFSKTPTRNFQAAGIDFFIPDIDDNNQEQVDVAIKALKKSYKLSDEDIEDFFLAVDYVCTNEQVNILKNQHWNFLHLFYGLKSADWFCNHKGESLNERIKHFLTNYLRVSKDGKIGIACQFSDMIFLNSGIKIALENGTDLEFKEKSGKGCAGWTVKAKIVDSDYSGYMHLSMQYLWYDSENGGTIYVGDKLTQGIVYNVLTDDAKEVGENEYALIMRDSQRGADGFGSSDIKH